MDLNIVQLMGLEYALVIVGLYMMYKCVTLKKDNMDYFFHFIFILNAYLICNIPIRNIELHFVSWNKELVFWLYVLSINFMTHTMLYWFIFVMKQVGNPFFQKKINVILASIPALFMVPLCIVNRWTGWLYYIDEEGYYHRGSIFVLQAAISYIYLLILIAFSLYYAFGKEKNASARKCLMSLIPIVPCTVLQNLYGGSYILLGALMGAVIMYVEICLDRQKAYEVSDAVSSLSSELAHTNTQVVRNMKTIMALSDMYHIISDVDLDKDTFNNIKGPKYLVDFCKNYTSARACLTHLAKSFFAEDYVETMERLIDPDTLGERLKNTNSLFADAVGKVTNGWVRTTVVVEERENDGKIKSVVFMVQDVNELVKQQKALENAHMIEEHARDMKELFVQTAEALSGAIDAKDPYTHGHSERVAQYSRMIAEHALLSEEECEEVYFAGLLHDVGKIGIKNSIINKAGKLTDEEFAQIKLHPVFGKQILSKIDKLPYLSLGAAYHHERYDGRGYPEGLKGDDIPRIARIIAVADAYDAMTSKRSYRDPIPQQQVREEIAKGLGTQFDPVYGKIMLHLIDFDLDYDMKEKAEQDSDNLSDSLAVKESRSKYLKGIYIDDHETKISFDLDADSQDDEVCIVFFDSLDGRAYNSERERKDLNYYEYGSIWGDGKAYFEGVRKAEINEITALQTSKSHFECTFLRIEDHLSFKIINSQKCYEGILALPDATRYLYVGLTGENCQLFNISSDKAQEASGAESIKRIAERISYIEGPEGDMPSIQIDGWRTCSTDGIEINDEAAVKFFSKSLPFARLIWHCPHIVVFNSDDGRIHGPNYHEYALVRMDGESWAESDYSTNSVVVNKLENFISWEKWKADNKEGREYKVSAQRAGRQVTLKASNSSIEIINVTTINEETEKVYLAVTGDQCVIENIRLS